MGIANKLTLFRLALTPTFVVLFIIGGTGGYLAAFLIGILVETTDFLDGYFARARKQTTDFGKLVDPMADSVAHFSMFLCFLSGGYAALWMVVLIFYREFIVAYIRIAAARAGVVLAARVSGKLKAITQAAVVLAILFLLVLTPLDDPERLEATRRSAQWLMGLVVLVTLWSGFDYLRSSLPLVRGLLRRES